MIVVLCLLLVIHHLRAGAEDLGVTPRWLNRESSSVDGAACSTVPHSTSIVGLQYGSVVVGGSEIVVLHVDCTEVGTESAVVVGR